MTQPGQPPSSRALELYVGPIALELTFWRAELTMLQEELRRKEAELAELEYQLSLFETQYRRALGDRYALLDDLADQIERARSQLTGNGQAGRSTTDGVGGPSEGSAPWFSPGEGDERNGDGTAQGQNWAWAWGEREPEPAKRPVVSEQAKRLFRQLARLIHPDLALTQAERERRTNLMVRANHAYEQGDVPTLQRLLDDWRRSPESVVGSKPEAELERILRRVAQVREQIEEVGKQIQELEASAMGWLRHRVEKAASEGWDLLSHMVRELDRQIVEARAELERLQRQRDPGYHRDPGYDMAR
jgi:chromosome segregation ATPase